MENINSFVASSIVEFKDERLHVSDLSRKINNILSDNEKFFFMRRCEEESEIIVGSQDDKTKGKQDAYNKQIAESQLVIFLFGNRFGEYTEEELRVAGEAAKNNGYPKILACFKKGCSPEPERKDKLITMLNEYKIEQCVFEDNLGLELFVLLYIEAYLHANNIDFTTSYDGKYICVGVKRIIDTSEINWVKKAEQGTIESNIDKIKEAMKKLIAGEGIGNFEQHILRTLVN